LALDAAGSGQYNAGQRTVLNRERVVKKVMTILAAIAKTWGL